MLMYSYICRINLVLMEILIVLILILKDTIAFCVKEMILYIMLFYIL